MGWFGVSACDRESSTMRRPWPTRAVSPRKKKMADLPSSPSSVVSQATPMLCVMR